MTYCTNENHRLKQNSQVLNTSDRLVDTILILTKRFLEKSLIVFKTLTVNSTFCTGLFPFFKQKKKQKNTRCPRTGLKMVPRQPFKLSAKLPISGWGGGRIERPAFDPESKSAKIQISLCLLEGGGVS